MGVSKSASASEIKKAYYGLAKKYHPDTNKDPGAKDKFAEAQTAYELLSDPKKRESYDAYGHAGFDPSGGGFNAGSAGNPFAEGNPFAGFSSAGFGGAKINIEDLFGAFGEAMGGGGRRKRRGFSGFETIQGEDIMTKTQISFMDAAKGVAKDININPLVKCGTCNGSGLKSGVKRGKCFRCNGTGTRVLFMQGGFQMASTCDTCDGSGVSVPKGGECSSCRGDGVVRQPKKITVDIPGGVEDGMKLQVPGEGDMPPIGQAEAGTRTQPGDLIVLIRVAADPKFQRSGADILYTAAIPLTTAILGGQVQIPTLDGQVKLKVPTGTGSGDKIKLGGMGMTRVNSRWGSKGDLNVEFKVEMPKYLSANQRTLVELLADEMGDQSAKRVMNIKMNQQGSTTPKDSSSTDADSHKNEGFLKSAWHTLTGQHSKPHEQENPPTDQEKKKASGSG